jgi:hypothetical protein
MRKTIPLCAAVVLVMTGAALAKDFRLEFKTLTADDAMQFPGGYGAYGQLRLKRPAELKREPEAKSARALYGQLAGSVSSNGFLFRLDESKGTGKGYDRLLIDLNDNHDLTDDPLAKTTVLAPALRASSSASERTMFGPIKVPAERRLGAGRPVYFAEAYVYTRDSGIRLAGSEAYYGQLRFKAGWYLEAAVDLGGVRQLVGWYDGNANLRLGDPWKGRTYKMGGEDRVGFTTGDSILQDLNGSGHFEASPLEDESSPFASILYLGATPHRQTFAADYKTVHIEPWTAALAELTLQPRGEQVRSVSLAQEGSPGQWNLVKPSVVNGKATVPPGNYRLYSSMLEGRTSAGEILRLSGYNRSLKKTFQADSGGSTLLACGAPLKVEVTAAKPRVAATVSTNRLASSLSRLVARTATPAEPTLRINAAVVGEGGESYSSFGVGRDFKGRPPKPAFTIAGPDGKQIAAGNLEYG